MRATAPLLALCASPEPGAERATEILCGERFTVYEIRGDGLAWGQAATDGYVGYVDAAGLGPDRPEGRRVTALASHRYARPSMKAPVLGPLPFLADVPVKDETGSEAGSGTEGFAALADGSFVPLRHLAPIEADAAALAARFLGVPYLWGGRSAAGLDCSALVQLALLATGTPCPRDSDMQAALVGRALDPDEPLRRGDLVFWRGHVGMLEDAGTLLHANAFHMAVAREPLATAVARIAASGGGAITARRRPETVS